MPDYTRFRSKVRGAVGPVPVPSAYKQLFDGPRWPAVSDPARTLESLAQAVSALKARSQIQSREKGDYFDSFVTVRDLISLNLLTVEGRQAPDDYIAWDDLRFPATAINPPGAASDPDVDPNTGLLLFDAGSTELVFALAQMPHGWLEGSYLVPHVHWEKTASAPGDVAWRLRYQISRIGDQRSGTWTDMGIVSTPSTPDDDLVRQHIISSFGQLDMDGSKISTCIIFELSRVGGDSADTFASDALLLEFDVHYQIDRAGSLQQYAKERAF